MKTLVRQRKLRDQAYTSFTQSLLSREIRQGSW
jgi:hypothetical protein